MILTAKFSPEMAADLKAYHGIDVEAQLVSIMAQQIAQEIDRLVLDDLNNLSMLKLKYSVTDINDLPSHILNKLL
jgi:hypothetical protein